MYDNICMHKNIHLCIYINIYIYVYIYIYIFIGLDEMKPRDNNSIPHKNTNIDQNQEKYTILKRKKKNIIWNNLINSVKNPIYSSNTNIRNSEYRYTDILVPQGKTPVGTITTKISFLKTNEFFKDVSTGYERMNLWSHISPHVEGIK
jgi:hypothetical protein